MTRFTNHLALNRTTTTSSAETVTDRSNVAPLKWFTFVVNYDAYIGINADADTNSMKLLAGESYTSPETVRVVKISILRATSNNVTLRGSAWY